MRRWPGCIRTSSRSPRSSTTTSPGPSPTATSRCTRWCASATAGRQADRDPDPHRRRCTTTPSTAWPRTGPTRRPGSKGYAGVWASGEYDAKIAVLRQLLAWERDLSGGSQGQGLFDDRIYVLTPDAAIVELPQGATPVDFAYTRAHQPGPPLPRRARRRRDGAAQHAAAERPDGRDHRGQGGRALARLAQRRTGLPGQPPRARPRCAPGSTRRSRTRPIARGREAVEKLLQREGKTALKLDDLAAQLGFKSADDLFEVVGKDEFSLRNIENAAAPARAARRRRRRACCIKKSRAGDKRRQGRRAGGGRRFADDAAGQVLQAGAARRDRRLRHARQGREHPPRRLQQLPRDGGARRRARDRGRVGRAQGRRRRRSTRSTWRSRPPTARACCATSPRCSRKEKMNVIGVQTQSVKGTAWMTFTVEIADAARLAQVLRRGRARCRACARRGGAERERPRQPATIAALGHAQARSSAG